MYHSMTFSRKEPLDKRPSSGYVKFKDTARVDENLVTAPFNHLMMYKSQLQLDKDQEEELYIDLVRFDFRRE